MHYSFEYIPQYRALFTIYRALVSDHVFTPCHTMRYLFLCLYMAILIVSRALFIADLGLSHRTHTHTARTHTEWRCTHFHCIECLHTRMHDAHTHARTHTHTHARLLVLTRPLARALSLSLSHTNLLTHTHTHTHVHTHYANSPTKHGSFSRATGYQKAYISLLSLK